MPCLVSCASTTCTTLCRVARGHRGRWWEGVLPRVRTSTRCASPMSSSKYLFYVHGPFFISCLSAGLSCAASPSSCPSVATRSTAASPVTARNGAASASCGLREASSRRVPSRDGGRAVAWSGDSVAGLRPVQPLFPNSRIPLIIDPVLRGCDPTGQGSQGCGSTKSTNRGPILWIYRIYWTDGGLHARVPSSARAP